MASRSHQKKRQRRKATSGKKPGVQSARRLPLLPLISDLETGEVLDVPGLTGLARSGNSFRPPLESELMPLPEGADLQLLPSRMALALDPDGEEVVLDGLAVAARIPVGCTRTLLPAFEEPPEGTEFLRSQSELKSCRRYSSSNFSSKISGEDQVCSPNRTSCHLSPTEIGPHGITNSEYTVCNHATTFVPRKI